MRELVRLAEEREAQAKAALTHLLESRSTALEESGDAAGTLPLRLQSACWWLWKLDCTSCRRHTLHV